MYAEHLMKDTILHFRTFDGVAKYGAEFMTLGMACELRFMTDT
jgi:hypothetical protein